MGTPYTKPRVKFSKATSYRLDLELDTMIEEMAIADGKGKAEMVRHLLREAIRQQIYRIRPLRMPANDDKPRV
jgi:predicted DNA-binding protein